MKGEKSMVGEHTEIKLGNLSGSRSDDYSNGDEQDDSDFNDQFEGKGKNLVASTLSLASFSGSAMSANSSLAKGKKDVKNDEKNKRAEELKRRARRGPGHGQAAPYGRGCNRRGAQARGKRKRLGDLSW